MDEKNINGTEPVYEDDLADSEFYNNLFSFRNVLILTAILGILLLLYLL